ncbi:fumarate hydratase C-terminal domain-containing protein [Candidatus Sumerlaeota bacterium]|nr:fumarate hydratase C-terminal domain-containing protein [Candidatus Sumerlaeota bacterium]
MKRIQLPVDEATIRSLRVGDEVSISGVMVTARDAAHKYMIENPAEEMRDLLRDSIIYHCGPVVRQMDGEWQFVSAGPTTSIREEPYQATVIGKFQVRGVIGKGGMGPKTAAGCKEHGAVYLHAVGGLGTSIAKSVKRVRDVLKLEEFGSPEAMWVIEVEDFPAVVTIDANGDSLHEKIEAESAERLKRLLG